MEAAYFRVYRETAGFLAIMARPQLNTGQPDSIATLRENGIGCIVSLLETSESSMLGLEAESKIVAEHGMKYISFPIPDYGVPSSLDEFSALTIDIFQLLGRGMNVLLHCRGGVGRSGLLAAGVLLQAGLDAELAFANISAIRGVRVPETAEQRDWFIHNHSAIVGK